MSEEMEIAGCEGCPMCEGESLCCNHPNAPKVDGYAPASWSDEYYATWEHDPPSDHGWGGGVPKLCPLRKGPLTIALALPAPGE